MRAFGRLRGALGVILVGHLVVLLLALAPSVPLAVLLHRAVADTAAGDAALFEGGGAVLFEALHDAAAGLGAVFFVWLAVGLIVLAASPWLTMSWLAGLAKKQRTSDALGAGARAYFPSIVVSMLLSPLAGVAGVLLVAGPIIAAMSFAGSPDARTHDLAVLGSLVPGLLFAAWVATAHDLARAALAVHDVGAWRAFKLGLRAALRPLALPAYVFWLALGLVLVAGGMWVGSVGDIGAWWATLLTVVLQQLFALLRSLVRARWLAGAVIRVELLFVRAAAPASAPEVDGETEIEIIPDMIGGSALTHVPEIIPEPSQPPPAPRTPTDRPESGE